jgi:hypothetical protein
LEDRKVKTLIYDIFSQRIVPLRMFPLITEHYAHVWEDNATPITGWWLHNTFIAHSKDLEPAPAFRATARLGKFFTSNSDVLPPCCSFLSYWHEGDSMDPNATWQLVLGTLRELNANPQDKEARIVAVALLESLASWIRSGGFPPAVD